MKKRHRKTMRGTVLFTTVSVMALLIIFLTGTLILASASNSRAHKSYSTNQASYTARAAIDSFVEAMVREGAIAAAVQEVANPSVGGATKKVVDIVVNDPTLGTIGFIDDHGVFQENQIIIENVGGGEFEYINDQGESVKGSDSPITGAKWVELDKVKITASARVGTEIETVSAYLRKRAGGQTTTTNPPPSPSVKGIQMTGSAGFPAGKNITGGLGVNLGNLEADVCTKVRNEMNIGTSLSFINSDLVWNTSTTQIWVKESKPVAGQDGYLPYSQTIINGSIYLPNNKFVVLDYDMPDDYTPGKWTNKEVPYVYVDGALVAQAGASVQLNQDKKAPFNMIVGTFVTLDNTVELNSTNLYMMDRYDETAEPYTVYTDVTTAQVNNSLNKPEDYTKGSSQATNYRRSTSDSTNNKFVRGDNYLGKGSTSRLYKWTQSIATSASASANVGGSVFCNGNLTMQEIEVQGDVYVEGDCHCYGSVKIGGTLLVGGNLYIHDNDKFSCGSTPQDNIASGGGSPAITDVKEVENLYVPASTIDMSKMEEITIDDNYKINYIEWVPGNHGTSPEAPYGVDLWGHAVESNELVIYYKWTDTTVVTDEVANSANKFANNTPYETLNADPEFDNVRKNVADIRFYENSTDASKNVRNFVNGEHYYYGVPTVDGGYAYPMGQEVDTAETYYRNTETNEIRTRTYINENPGVEEHYVRVSIDGTPTSDDVGMHDHTYYRNNDPNNYVFDAAAAYTAAPASSSAGLYPSDMTRESIYGTYGSSGFEPAPEATKFVVTLQEAREALGLTATGEVSPSSYPYVFDGTQEGAPNVSSVPMAIENANIVTPDVFTNVTVKDAVTGTQYQVAAINQSCRIKGSVIGSADRELKIGNTVAIPKDRRKVNGSNDDFKVLYFSPGEDDIYVVLENVNDNENLAFVVDKTGAGSVYFIIDGNFKPNNKVLIIPNNYYKGMDFDYTKDWGITYYGTYGSSIEMVNPSTLVGCFRMPYTKFKSNVAGQMEVNYTAEDGIKYENTKPSIVGNALFSGVEATNDFVNCYTSTGSSSGSGAVGGSTVVNTEVGYFDIMYMLGN